MIDIILLRLIKHRKEWSMLKDIIPRSNLTPETQALVTDFGKYFADYPSHDQIDLMTFMPKFRNWHAGISDEQFASYTAILRNIAPEPDEQTPGSWQSHLLRTAMQGWWALELLFGSIQTNRDVMRAANYARCYGCSATMFARYFLRETRNTIRTEA